MKDTTIILLILAGSLILNVWLLGDLVKATNQTRHAEANASEAWAMVQELRANFAQGWPLNF